MAWKENHGFQPGETKGKRVKVKLVGGRICGDKPVSDGAAAGWPADAEAAGKGQAMNWSLDLGPATVTHWDFV